MVYNPPTKGHVGGLFVTKKHPGWSVFRYSLENIII